MNSSDYEAVGYEHQIYCVGCLPDSVEVTDDAVAPVFADSEWDVYPVCVVCGYKHDYVVLLRDEMMLDIKEARKELIHVGCVHARGDTLRFMYANILAFEQGLSVKPNSINWPIPGLYKELGEVPDSGIYRKVQLIRKEFTDAAVERAK